MPLSKSEGLDLSGVWAGVYSYSGASSPVPFSAKLAQSLEWITGTTEEIINCADATSMAMTATLQGRRDGAQVSWLKLYDRLWGTFDAVSYRGEVNTDASEISGRWTIGPDWSGAFLMIRTPLRLGVEP